MPWTSPRHVEPAWMRPHAVYRHWNAAGELLYVGTTSDPDRRWAAHYWQPWRPLVAASQVTWFPTRGLAFLAEWVAIDTEHPIHNGHDHLRTRAQVGRYARRAIVDPAA